MAISFKCSLDCLSTCVQPEVRLVEPWRLHFALGFCFEFQRVNGKLSDTAHISLHTGCGSPNGQNSLRLKHAKKN